MPKGQSKPTRPGFVLASGSPRRQELLAKLGLTFEVVVPEIPEIQKKGERPEEFAKRMALDKAMSVKNGLYVLAADTIVVLGEKIFGKPSNKKESISFLEQLAGRTHQVITGYAIIQSPDRIIVSGVCRSEVTFKLLTRDVIKEYAETGEPIDKAGAYAAQGKGKELIEKIKGSVSNVIGLPVENLIPWFKKLGFL